MPNATVMKCAMTGCGGAPNPIASGQLDPMGIVVSTNGVYWANSPADPDAGAVMKCDLDGGNLTVVAAQQDNPRNVAVDATSVYWKSRNGAVVKCPLAGRTNGPVVLASAQVGPFATTVDATSVYWTTDSTVMKVPLSGGTPVTLAVGQSYPSSIAVNAISVYWTNTGTSQPNSGSVMKLTPK